MDTASSRKVLLLDFDKKRHLVVGLDDFSVLERSTKSPTDEIAATGYSTWVRDKYFGKRQLVALFVKDDATHFLKIGTTNTLIKIEGPDWLATRERTGLTKYRFNVMHKGKLISSTSYHEFFESAPEDFDASFMVSLIFWISDEGARSRYIRFWNESTDRKGSG